MAGAAALSKGEYLLRAHFSGLLVGGGALLAVGPFFWYYGLPLTGAAVLAGLVGGLGMAVAAGRSRGASRQQLPAALLSLTLVVYAGAAEAPPLLAALLGVLALEWTLWRGYREASRHSRFRDLVARTYLMAANFFGFGFVLGWAGDRPAAGLSMGVPLALGGVLVSLATERDGCGCSFFLTWVLFGVLAVLGWGWSGVALALFLIHIGLFLFYESTAPPGPA